VLLKVVQYYHEFHPNDWIVQPWNALSSFTFFIPVIYWLYTLRDKLKTYWVVTAMLPLLTLNGIGSTLFHWFSGGQVYLLLDVLPPLILILFLTVYFWRVATGSWVVGILAIALFAGLHYLNQVYTTSNLPSLGTVNVFYLINGSMVLVPLSIVLAKSSFKYWGYLVSAVALLGIALLFRWLDYPRPNPLPDLLPQGTHFLWHIFSALAVFPLVRYVIEVQKWVLLHMR
jgi:hypothetical protein